MTEMTCLDKNYSTTRFLTREQPVIEHKPEDKLESVLFLPEGENRKGEGGLRSQGYFKASQTDKPLITVITVVFNGEQFLEQTIQSVINQTYDNVEYIIIDGCSTDGSVDIIRKYEHAIDYWVSEKDLGTYDAMNKGIDLASGQWLNFMNAGDLFYKNNILQKIFNNNIFHDVTVIYGDLEIDYGEFKRIEKAKSIDALWKGMVFSHQSCFINSKFHKKHKYNLNYYIGSDFEFFYNIYNKNKVFKYIGLIVSIMDTEGLSDGNRFKSINQRHKIVNDYRVSIKNNIYYIYLYTDQFIRMIAKLLLSKSIINLIKKRK